MFSFRLLTFEQELNKSFQADETNVVVSVTERFERDLVKRFDELSVDWAMVGKQMQNWSHLLRSGKRLRINV